MGYTGSKYRPDSRDLRLAEQLHTPVILPTYVHGDRRMYWIEGVDRFLITYPDGSQLWAHPRDHALAIIHREGTPEPEICGQLTLF